MLRERNTKIIATLGPSSSSPSPTGMQTAIGLGSTLAGLYRAFPGT